jgi:glutamine synthetase
MTDQFLTTLDLAHVQFVRILWCDNANIIRAKAVHRRRYSHYRDHGVGIAQAQQAVQSLVDAPAAGSGLGPVGEVRLVPDEATLMPLPYAPGHARVMGNMMLNQAPWSRCPRAFLQRMIAAAAAQNLEIQAAFENEFYLLNSADSAPSELPLVPADRTLFAATASMDQHYAMINDLATALLVQGLEIEQYYPESGPGQQEISIRYQPALLAADQQIVFRETVRAIAHQHHLKASFLPKIFPNYAGNGTHIHFSLWRHGQNLIPTDTGQLSDLARQFVAGILHHLPALMAITTPSPNSYRRLQPQSWSGAFRCWGYDNREAAVRVPTHPVAPSPTHVELKTADATANPYLALGAMIAAGLDGISQNRLLLEPIATDPATLSDAERERQQCDRLPSNLDRAIQHLRENGVLRSALGDDLSTTYLAVRQAEYDAMHDWSLKQEVQHLWARY